MPVLESITRLVQICARKAVTEFIISPGSRSAPLTISLARHPDMQTRVVPDERSAAFLALGMALKSRQTVGLVCTSGTAVLNYGPAIAEAYYQQVPLLILTADRPSEWLEQQDGQTLNQREVFGKHVKASYELPADFSHPDAIWFIERTVNEAINLSQSYPQGPVHINVPIREPFYPKADEQITFPEQVKIVRSWNTTQVLSPEQWVEIREIWEDSPRKLIVAGQSLYQPELIHVLKQIQQELQIPVVGDILSNLHEIPETIRLADAILMQKDEPLRKELAPDLLITFGNSVISKNLKLFLRQANLRVHWHIQPAGKVADPFQTLTDTIATQPLHFFRKLFEDIDYQSFLNEDEVENNDDYFQLWQQQEQQARLRLKNTFTDAPFSEFEAVYEIMSALPESGLLHVANSMPIRYANFVGINHWQSIEFFANRGTSGIDGCTGTALGSALVTHQLVTLITGDMAFLYDRNSLWHNRIPPNLRIIVLNNHGGGIFRLIDGPSTQPELEDYFETHQHQTAENTAKDFGIPYFRCHTMDELKGITSDFFAMDGTAKLLEIETDRKLNETIWKKFKKG
ncbi:2-succinyl-5-enolpyruvyl-6-hydroxy-3-cyclohexene-1-carboxylic-acid synthase [Cytophagaceae bacterium DM2B3-1]|uniref:2-succinyl-5-enolpyruvyl-6-hydroxy-3-cyclohexene-1-carboxylate synthase n=1 Tax=Xanthocytophaga flava TaxID=3048013 RepID=A0ABT7CVV4_9BACT|nr:2-succinyl-5-enolpyruvyl-6-hydroxy-3-cyclohexene-1-carboxylic-acid synthase [Xanthocytophaga flavus]MDJ1497909.1 2-succinyl-5-enolpyruvyl-6-hydroxy-3-cyclohexene-1-carboxylic-acid synthase [Xanthocytophaga flavus]